MSDYEHQKREIASGKLRFLIVDETNCPGTFALNASIPSMPYPIGIVYLRWVGDSTLDIVNIIVDDKFRRFGVADLMLKELINWKCCKLIFTGSVNDASEGLIKKNGFKKNSVGWFRIIKKVS